MLIWPETMKQLPILRHDGLPFDHDVYPAWTVAFGSKQIRVPQSPENIKFVSRGSSFSAEKVTELALQIMNTQNSILNKETV